MYSNQSTYDNLLDSALQSAMSGIKQFNMDQLNELMENDEMIDSVINDLPQVRSIPTDKESALVVNKSLAEWNLAQKPRIDSLKTETLNLHSQAKNLKNEVEMLKEKLDSVSSSKSLEVTSSLMQVAAQEADDDAEQILSQFENGEISIDIFLKQYKEKKTLAHLRKIKSDRLSALLREQTYSTRPSKAMPVAPPVSNHPGYPMTNFSNLGFGGGYPNISAENTEVKHPFF